MIEIRASTLAVSLGLILTVAPVCVRAETPPTAPSIETGESPSEEAQTSAEKEASGPTPVDSGPVLASPETDQPNEPQVTGPTPAEPKTATTEGRSRRSKRDYSVPFYQQKRPQWALELAAAVRSGFGSEGSLTGTRSDGLRSFQVLGEYQPEWFQSIGVLGVGISAGLYTTDPTNQVTNNLSGLLSYGFQARYQARWIRNQWIVPTIGYSSEWIRYALKSEASGTVNAGGIFYGAMLLLSAFDEGSAAELYASLGVSRVYLIAESRSREGADLNLSLSGHSYFFGLRFEF